MDVILSFNGIVKSLPKYELCSDNSNLKAVSKTEYVFLGITRMNENVLLLRFR